MDKSQGSRFPISKQAEAESSPQLDEGHTILQAIVEGTTDAVFVKDTQGRYLMINSAGAEFLGRSIAQIIGKDDTELFSPETAQQIMEGDRRVVASGEPCTYEDIGSAAGVTRIYLSTKWPHRDRRGRVVGLIGISRDITKRKRAEEALRRSEAQIRALLENATDVIARFDREGRYLYVNPAIRLYAQSEPESLIGKRFGESGVIPADDLLRWRQALNSVFEKREPAELEFVYETSRRRLWRQCRMAPEFSLDGQVESVLAITRDVTERKRAEAALRESEEQYRHLVEHAGDIIYGADATGRLSFYNSTAVKMLKYRDEELEGRLYLDLVRPDYRESTRAIYTEQIRERRPNTYFEFPAIAGDGTEVWLGQNVQLVTEGDNVVGVQAVARDITERKRAEDALKESEAKFRALADTAPCAIFIVKGEKYRYLNRAAEEITGYSRGELLGQNFWDNVHPDFRELVKERGLARQRGAAVPSRYEFKLVTRRGEERWVDFSAAFMEFEGGPAVIGTATDVTDRRRVEEALRDSEARFRAVAETAACVILIYQGTRFRYVNPATEAITGYTREELLRMNIWDFIHPDHQELVKERWIARQQGQLTQTRFEYKILTKDGRERWVDFIAGGFINFAGQPAGLGTAYDITDRKAAVEALQDSEERYRSLIESAPDVIFALSTEGTITSLNPAFETITGWKREDWVGKFFEALIHPDDLPIAIGAMFGSMEGIDLGTVELRVLSSSGAHLVGEFTLTPQIKGGRTVGLLGIARDISDRKRAEDALARQTEELAHANAMLSSLSLTDELTRLYNRRGFLTLAEQQLKYAYRNKTEMLLMFADLDGLKQINDSFGHQEGDRALRQAAEILRHSFRGSDIIARLGGDEFTVLVTDSFGGTADLVSSRLQRNLTLHNAQPDSLYELSLSTGWARFDPAKPESVEELMARADAALYQHRRNTRGD